MNIRQGQEICPHIGGCLFFLPPTVWPFPFFLFVFCFFVSALDEKGAKGFHGFFLVDTCESRDVYIVHVLDCAGASV